MSGERGMLKTLFESEHGVCFLWEAKLRSETRTHDSRAHTEFSVYTVSSIQSLVCARGWKFRVRVTVGQSRYIIPQTRRRCTRATT